jgi:hypothetical protein
MENMEEESGSEILGTDTIPTKYGVSLSLSQWKVLCSATQVVDESIYNRNKKFFGSLNIIA